MLSGYRTYIVVLLTALYNVLSQLGLLSGIDSAQWEIFINVVLALLGVVFNFVGRKTLKAKIAQGGEK